MTDSDFSPHIGSIMGVNECYTVWNVNGSVFGNCGYNSTAFLRCAARYVIPPATIMRVRLLCVYVSMMYI